MEEELEVILESEEELDLTLESEEELDVALETDIIEVPVYNHEKYTGEYDITPLAFQQQELETKDKILEENILVKEVPFYEVSNTEGITVYIGSEV